MIPWLDVDPHAMRETEASAAGWPLNQCTRMGKAENTSTEDSAAAGSGSSEHYPLGSGADSSGAGESLPREMAEGGSAISAGTAPALSTN